MDITQDYINHTVLITGGTNGIGKAAAYKFASLNANIIFLCRNEELVTNIINEFKEYKYKGSYDYFLCDLSNIENVSETAKAIFKKYNNINSFIHCAGVCPLRPANLTSINIMQETFNINHFSFIEICRLFAKQKFTKDNMGNIIAMSSLITDLQEKGRLAYASSKTALESAIIVLSKEYISRNIKVNAIKPAMVNTSMASSFLEDTNQDNNIQSIQPLGLIEPNEVVNIMLYLLSHYADKITGSIIKISGGGNRCIILATKILQKNYIYQKAM